MNEPTRNGTKRLYRSRKGHMVAGVCAGLGEYLGIDAVLVRLAFVVLTVLGGFGILLYLCVWLLVPEDGGDGSSIAEEFVNKQRRS